MSTNENETANETETSKAQAEGELAEIPAEELEAAAGGKGGMGGLKAIPFRSIGKGLGTAINVGGAVGAIGGFIATLAPPKK